MRIDRYSFVYFVIDGKTYEHEIKIINEKIVFWKDHGLSEKDVRDVAEAKPKPSVLIIGTGSQGVVDVTREIKDKLKRASIRLVIEQTGKACSLYNELSKNENVAAVLHSTC